MIFIALTLERSLSASEAARFTLFTVAFEVQLCNPSELGAPSGREMNYI